VVETDLSHARQELATQLGNNWLKDNHVKAFFHVLRAPNLADGVQVII